MHGHKYIYINNYCEEARSSSEISDLLVSVYIYYIIIYRTSGLLVPREVPNVKWCQHTNVTRSLKFKGHVRKQFKILNIVQYCMWPPSLTQYCSIF